MYSTNRRQYIIMIEIKENLVYMSASRIHMYV